MTLKQVAVLCFATTLLSSAKTFQFGTGADFALSQLADNLQFDWFEVYSTASSPASSIEASTVIRTINIRIASADRDSRRPYDVVPFPAAHKILVFWSGIVDLAGCHTTFRYSGTITNQEI